MNNYRLTIQRFSKSLNLALYDRQLELNNIHIRYYYDNDVIFKLVSGFDFCYPRVEQNIRALSVRGLLAFGYLGEICILRPHAFEFYEKIHYKSQNRLAGEELQFIQRSQMYIKSSGIEKDMKELSYILSQSSTDDTEEEKDQKCKQFINILQKKSRETFCRIEQIDGTWDQRLRRFYDSKLLNFENIGPDITELNDQNKSILKTIYRTLLESRPELYMNAFQDAYALAIINKLISESDENITKEVYRFYTETGQLEKSIINTEIKDLLTYQKSIANIKPPPDGNFIYRDADYFVVRAMFTALVPNKPGDSSDDIKQLIILSEKLNQYEKSLEDNDFSPKLESLGYDGKKLSDLVQQFSNLEITQTLWHQGKIPEHLYKYNELKKWVEIFEFAQGERVGNLLHIEIEDIKVKLDTQVIKIKNWADNFKSITSKIPNNPRLKTHIPLEPLRDLGLVRWNYELSAGETEKILNSIENLSSSDETDMYDAAQNLVTDMELSKTDPRKCLTTCAVLWAFGCFEEIDKLILDLLKDVDEKVPISLYVMRYAARLKSGVLISDDERNNIVDDVVNLLNQISDKRSILLGAGFVLFHIWKQIMIGKNTLERSIENQSNQQRYLSEKAFEFGEEAIGRFQEFSLPWAYAINHCVYVGTMTSVYPDQTLNHFETLLRIKGSPAIWSPRFDDTLGCFYLLRAQRKFFNSINKSKVDISRDIKYAEQYLNSASKNDPGDIDIREHLGLLDKLINELGDSSNPSMLPVSR